MTGQLVLRVLTTDSFIKADVQCLDIQGGDTATLSGVVDRGFLFGQDPTGLCYVASAKDNGEGAASAPDLVSFAAFGPCSIVVPHVACSELPQPTVLQVSGNVQVKP